MNKVENKKIGNLTIRLNKNLLESYKQHCEKQGFDMSKRLRMFIESEIPKDYRLIKVDSVIYVPTSEIDIITIMGFNFTVHKLPPKCFVIKTDDVIEGDIQFYHNNINYKCDDVKILKEENGDILIECVKFIIEYI